MIDFEGIGTFNDLHFTDKAWEEEPDKKSHRTSVNIKESLTSFWHVPSPGALGTRDSEEYEDAASEDWKIVGSPPRRSMTAPNSLRNSSSDSSDMNPDKDRVCWPSDGSLLGDQALIGSSMFGSPVDDFPFQDWETPLKRSSSAVEPIQSVAKEAPSLSSSFHSWDESRDWSSLAQSPVRISSSAPVSSGFDIYREPRQDFDHIGANSDAMGLSEGDDPSKSLRKKKSGKLPMKKNEKDDGSFGTVNFYKVEFKSLRTGVFCYEEGTLKIGDVVLVEADRGKDLGKITSKELKDVQDKDPKYIYRLAQPAEINQLSVNFQDEAKALTLCQTKIRQKKLPMEVIEAEYQWDRKKLTYFFIADRRIDFRELVRELFKIYKTRIWMCSVEERAAKRK